MPVRHTIKKVLLKEEKSLITKIDELDEKFGNLGLAKYVNYLDSPKRIIWNNFLAGVMHGFGFVVGATVVVTLVTLIISYLVGLPVIGDGFRWMGEMLQQKVN